MQSFYGRLYFKINQWKLDLLLLLFWLVVFLVGCVVLFFLIFQNPHGLYSKMYLFIQDGIHNLHLLEKQAQLLSLINITHICYGQKLLLAFRVEQNRALNNLLKILGSLSFPSKKSRLLERNINTKKMHCIICWGYFNVCVFPLHRVAICIYFF